MRTERAGNVFLKLPAHRPESIRNIRPGSELAAAIVIRHGPKEAVLDIAGMRIRARFPGGVPDAAAIHLKLERIEKNSFFFKIIGGTEVNNYRGAVLEHAVLSPGAEFSHVRGALARFVESGAASLYHLSAALLNLDRDDGKKETPASILRRLAAAGFGRESLQTLSILNLFSHFPAETAMLMAYLLIGDDMDKWHGHTDDDREDLLSKIIQEADTIAEGASAGEALEAMAQMLGNGGSGKNPSSGTVAFVADDDIIPARYILSGDSILLELRFTELGLVDILGRRENSVVDIRLYCEKAEAVEALAGKEEIGVKTGCPVNITVMRMGDIINKIVEINSHYSLNSDIDVMA